MKLTYFGKKKTNKQIKMTCNNITLLAFFSFLFCEKSSRVENKFGREKYTKRKYKTSIDRNQFEFRFPIN